jgi:hypothetical protein
MNILAALICGTLIVTSAGCATITRGSSEKLTVTSRPDGATVTASNGLACGVTPCEIEAKRRSNFSVTLEKPGCDPVTVEVSHKTSERGAAGVAGNVLIGGIIGLGVDAATGASQDLYPNPVAVDLNCSGA